MDAHSLSRYSLSCVSNLCVCVCVCVYLSVCVGVGWGSQQYCNSATTSWESSYLSIHLPGEALSWNWWQSLIKVLTEVIQHFTYLALDSIIIIVLNLHQPLDWLHTFFKTLCCEQNDVQRLYSECAVFPLAVNLCVYVSACTCVCVCVCVCGSASGTVLTCMQGFRSIQGR